MNAINQQKNCIRDCDREPDHVASNCLSSAEKVECGERRKSTDTLVQRDQQAFFCSEKATSGAQ